MFTFTVEPILKIHFYVDVLYVSINYHGAVKSSLLPTNQSFVVSKMTLNTQKENGHGFIKTGKHLG